jgi:hypothetical protein
MKWPVFCLLEDMKNLCFLLTLFITPAMAQTVWRIEPGKYIGNTKIGAAMEETAKQLGPANGGDAAMGKAWGIWYRKNADNSLDSSRFLAIYSAVDGNEPAHHVKQVRINTASFKTAKGIKVGSSLASIKKAYPQISRAGIYENPVSHKRIELYDDTKRGIAFEITGKKCTAVTVHKSGEDLNTYLQFPGYEGFNKLPGE